MRNIFYVGLFIISLIFQNVNVLAQEKEWKTKTTDSGKITVRYCISERLDENGKKVPLIEDSTITTVDGISIKSCILLMKDVSKHKDFTGDYISELVKTLSDNEWIIYYYTKNPWPIANSDCVSKMTFTEDEHKKIAVFNFTAAPSEFKKGDVARMNYYHVTYAFKEVGNGKIEITLTGKTSPPVKVPLWIIKSAFPGAPSSAIQKLIELLKNKKHE